MADALEKYTPIDELIEQKCVETFMPEISEDELANLDLSGTPLENLSPEELENLNDLDWKALGITPEDILSVLGEIPKDVQISEIENASIPAFIKDMLLQNNNSTVYGELGVNSFPAYVATSISRLVLNVLSFLVTFLLGDYHCKSTYVCGKYYRRTSGSGTDQSHSRRRTGACSGTCCNMAWISDYNIIVFDCSGKRLF